MTPFTGLAVKWRNSAQAMLPTVRSPNWPCFRTRTLTPGFHVFHRRLNRPTEGIEDGRVVGDAVNDGDAFGGIEGKIVPDAAILPHAGGKLLPGEGVAVIAKPLEMLPENVAPQAKPISRLATPGADDLLLARAGNTRRGTNSSSWPLRRSFVG